MSGPAASPDRRLTRGADHVETRHGDRIMAMSLKRGKYFAVEGTGARIWDLLRDPKTESELVETLTAEYDVTPADCRRDLRAFLRDLEDYGLIRPAD